MKFADLYELLLKAGNAASSSLDRSPVDDMIQKLGMTACPGEDPKFLGPDSAFELVDEDERLLVQYRWYDTSKAFSVRPDMNVFLMRHVSGDTLIAQDEFRFLDRF